MSEPRTGRRRNRRIDTTLVVRRSLGQPPMIAHDLSVHGMQVSTAIPLWPGMGFDAALVLRGVGRVEVHCRVNELVEIPCGIGLSLTFVRLGEEARSALERYVEEHSAFERVA